MPFTVRDAHRHKHGMSARQARQWVAVANGVLRRCLADGGTDASCAGPAITQANGVVGEPAQNTAQYLTIQSSLTVQPTRLTVNNREYLTAPAVLAVCGVLNGGLLREEAIVPIDWDGIPVVLNHPSSLTGEPISARSPEVIAQYGMGHIYRACQSTGYRQGNPVPSLQAELWLDIAQCEALGGEAMQALQMIETQQPCEVSTAFFPEAVRERGSFYGTPYSEVYYSLRPDHLALLPNGVGACSWTDGGCGCPRLNHADDHCACTSPECTCHQGAPPMEEETPVRGWRAFLQTLRQFVTHEEAALPTPDVTEETTPGTEEGATEEADAALVTEQTDNDVREALYGCLAREMGVNVTPIYIDSLDTTTQSFIYRQGERLLRRYWQVQDDVVTLAAEVEDVQRSTEYIPVPGTSGPAEESNPMTMAVPTVLIKTRVNRLIANGARSGWTEDDRHRLEAMDEATLIRLEQMPQREPAPERQEPTTLEDALQYVPAQFRETLSNATQAYEKRKQKLIDVIVANKQNPFDRSELEVMTADRLEQIVVMAGEDIPDTATRPQAQSYSGRRIPQLRIVQEDEDTVPAPPKTLELVVARQRELGLRA